MSVLVRPTNGVSYGIKYTVTASDVTAGFILFDFRKNGVGTYRYNLVATWEWLSSAGLDLNEVGIITVTYPIKGQVRLAFASGLAAGQVINLIVQADSGTLTYSA